MEIVSGNEKQSLRTMNKKYKMRIDYRGFHGREALGGILDVFRETVVG